MFASQQIVLLAYSQLLRLSGTCSQLGTPKWSESRRQCRFGILPALQDRKFYAHRIALLASSECFRAMFDGHYKEKQASVIPIPNIRFAVFERMMRCIYTGARAPPPAPWL